MEHRMYMLGKQSYVTEQQLTVVMSCHHDWQSCNKHCFWRYFFSYKHLSHCVYFVYTDYRFFGK